MKKIEVEITSSVVLEYDEDSAEFKQALSDYKETIYPDGTMEDMIRYVAYNMMFNCGSCNLIEGVGHVANAGQLPKDMYCGINILGLETAQSCDINPC